LGRHAGRGPRLRNGIEDWDVHVGSMKPKPTGHAAVGEHLDQPRRLPTIVAKGLHEESALVSLKAAPARARCPARHQCTA
jgi:hypothetical protein